MINFECAKTYCNEDISRIENYDKAIADSNQMWQCHHRRELETSRKELIKIGQYFKRPASELIFLTEYEHKSLHNKGNKNSLGKHHTEETRRKIAEGNKGKNKGKIPWIKGKHLAEEHKQKLSEAKKGKMFTEEHKRNISEAHKGVHLSPEAKLKMSIAIKGRHWFNNGVIEVQVKECPEGFVKGRLKHKNQITV